MGMEPHCQAFDDAGNLSLSYRKNNLLTFKGIILRKTRFFCVE